MAGVDAGGNLRRRQAEIARAHHLALAHGNAADDLRQVLAEPDADEVLLQLAEGIVAHHALGVGGKLPHRFDIGREPGEAVGGALLALGQLADHPALHHHPLPHLGGGVGEQRLQRRRGVPGEFDQLVIGGGVGSGDRH